jgi:hypothetical protein
MDRRYVSCSSAGCAPSLSISARPRSWRRSERTFLDFRQSQIFAQKADTDQKAHKNWRFFQNAIRGNCSSPSRVSRRHSNNSDPTLRLMSCLCRGATNFNVIPQDFNPPIPTSQPTVSSTSLTLQNCESRTRRTSMTLSNGRFFLWSLMPSNGSTPVCSQGPLGRLSMDHSEGRTNAAFIDTEDSLPLPRLQFTSCPLERFRPSPPGPKQFRERQEF